MLTRLITRTTSMVGLIAVAALVGVSVVGCTGSTTRSTGTSLTATTPTPSRSNAASPRGSSSSTHSIQPSPPSSLGVPADWSSHVDFNSLAHPDIDCGDAGEGGKIDVDKVVSSDVTGDRLPDAIVQMQCAHRTSAWPEIVDVYSDASGTPTVIGSVLTQREASLVTTISTHGDTVTIGLVTWGKHAANCCPDLQYTRTFTWTGHTFLAGPLVDVVRPCGDTAFTVSAADQLGATGHSSIVLRFRNRLPQPCTIRGYPGLDAVSASGTVLAHATRTLSGFAGGAHSVSKLAVGAGQTVSALAEWMNFNPSTSGPCPTSRSIAVTPANTTYIVYLPVHATTCRLQIHPTVSGTTGDG
jgi:Domain of unknown function (DUF4232)